MNKRLDNSINLNEMQRRMCEENVKVSSYSIQSGNQIDYQLQELNFNSGPVPSPELENCSTGDNAEDYMRPSSLSAFSDLNKRKVSIKKPIKKFRRQARGSDQGGLENCRNKRATKLMKTKARPGAPHNTNDYLANRQSVEESTLFRFPTHQTSLAGSMIGIVSFQDLITAERKMLEPDKGKLNCVAPISKDSGISSDPYRFNRETSMNEETKQEDTIGVLLCEIKKRDQRIEQLQSLLQGGIAN